jgi:thymidylate kinase
MMTDERGKLIVVTGCDGSGKSTIMNLIKKHNPNAIALKTPLPPYDNFREIFTGEDERNTHKTFRYFQKALESDLKIINNILNNGKDIIIERYIETTWAFHLTNCLLNNKDPNHEMLNTSIQKPDLTIVLVADIEERMNRINTRDKKDWWETRDFQLLYQHNLIKTSNEMSKYVKYINTGSNSIEDTREIITRNINYMNIGKQHCRE